MPMIDAQPVTCPSWCSNGACTIADHASDAVYLPASGGEPVSVGWQLGATFAAIGVGVSFQPARRRRRTDGGLHITSERHDVSVHLRVAEARQLIELLTSAVEQASAR